MIHNKYIIKSLAPWMIDELLAFSETNKFDIIFLREQESFYKEAIDELTSRNIIIYTKPRSNKGLLKKIVVILQFTFMNLLKFKFNYNGVIGFKSIWWFLLLDITKFSKESNLHAQFATQGAIISLLIKRYFNDRPKYSFTFHAHDIYFRNMWFDLLVNESVNSFSISDYNIEYVKDKYSASSKLSLARLGVFREDLIKDNLKSQNNPTNFTLGLMSRFVEKKGIKYLLQAMLDLKKQGYDFIKLVLAGDGPLSEEFNDFIENNNLSYNIVSLGRVNGNQKKDFYTGIDAFILPSISIKNDQDGIPVVLMEAVAYGLPLISTNVSGIPEICVHDFNGILVKEKNVEVLVEAILELNENKLKRKKYAENSIIMSEKYDIRKNSLEKIKKLEWA